MIEKIDNGILEISVKSEGAELAGLKGLEDGHQYIWEGYTKYWGKHSSPGC